LKETSLAYFELYLREALLGSINNLLSLPCDAVVLNFSNTIMSDCLAWYAQGPVSTVLRNIRTELPLKYKTPLQVCDFALTKLDKRMIRRMRKLSRFVVANSDYCRICYERLGIQVDTVIYEPLDCRMFQPSTISPLADYVLTYFGKETDYPTVKRIADAGVRIKAFGGKLRSIPKAITEHSNVETLGWISQNMLVQLYSNALYTVFPFTDEEFGYVPAESMACGTPVLTYNIQGPAEVIIEGSTGWLTENQDRLTKTAIYLWKNPEIVDGMRSSCRKRAMEFDTKVVARKWSLILKQ
jgi:glycosyltransferase involved in cell wall biosynthesis